MDTKLRNRDEVEKLKSALRGLSEGETREVVSEALTNMPGITPPVFCPLFPVLTGFENDLETIMDRVTISTVISGFDGNVLNESELFTVTATVKNCSRFELRNAELTASDTEFARVFSGSPADIGVLGQGQVSVQSFTCISKKETAGTQPLITLRLNAKPIFTGAVAATADGVVEPS